MLVKNGKPFTANLARLSDTLSRARTATRKFQFDCQLTHNFGLTIVGALILLTYEHAAQLFGLPSHEIRNSGERDE